MAGYIRGRLTTAEGRLMEELVAGLKRQSCVPPIFPRELPDDLL